MKTTKEFPRKKFSDTKLYQSSLKGEIIKSLRTFGVEIEAIPPGANTDHESQHIIGEEMGEEIGLNSDAGGLEWTTPPLAGRIGEDYIKKLSSLLKAHKWKVNRDCGLHVHLGATDFQTDHYALQTLLYYFVVFEEVFLSFLPPWRRTSHWCTPIRQRICLDQIRGSSSVETLRKISNFCKIGFSVGQIFSEGHIEIRYHAGTTDDRKILEWVNLFQLVMDKAARRDTDMGHHIFTLASTEEKTARLFDLIKLPQSSVEYFLCRQEAFRVKLALPTFDMSKLKALIESAEAL